MKEWKVDKKESGTGLLKFCKSRLNQAPDSFFYKMARKKNLTLNDKKCTGRELLKEGDVIKLYVSDDTVALFSCLPKEKTDGKKDRYEEAYESLDGIRIIDEEEDFLILYKPAGVLSQKAKPDDLSINEWYIGYLLKNEIISEESLRIFKPSVLNRLDFNTAGLILCGITPRGSRFGSEIIRDKSLRKFYLMEVEGKCELNGTLEGFLSKDEKKNMVSFYKGEEEIPDGEKTSYVGIKVKSLEYREDTDSTLMEAELLTGKSHQIRAIMASFGYPLWGDMKYGHGGSKDGQRLLAYRLEFPEIHGDFAYLSKKVIELPVSGWNV